MTTPFKKRLWKLSKWFGGLFLFLFLFRLAYGYMVVESPYSQYNYGDFFSGLEDIRRNYASEKHTAKRWPKSPKDAPVQDLEPESSMDAGSGQKFEKTASVKSRSTEFDEDEKRIRSKTEGFGGIIQYEQKEGQKGNRKLHLQVGVTPEKFDSFYAEVLKIGSIKGAEVTKVDKTNEYRKLNAQKASLEKVLSSLGELKSKSGDIAEYISLNDKILEIEQSLQDLGVELGNFDEENEFCTVRFSLSEGATEKGISFMHRVRVALEWSLQYFLVAVASILCVSVAVFVILLIVDKLKLLNAVNRKMNE